MCALSLVLFVSLVYLASSTNKEEAVRPVGVWDDSDHSRAEAYYDDEDFFAEKAGKVPSIVQPAAAKDKSFFLETKTSMPVKEANGHSRIQKLKKNILKPMRFKSQVAQKQEQKTAQDGMPPLPVNGIFANPPSPAVAASAPPCNAFANNVDGQSLFQYFYTMNPSAYASPCPGFATKAPEPPQSSLVPLSGAASSPYYSQPIQRMMPQLQWPYMQSPAIHFYSNGMRYPANMEHFDSFGPVKAAGAGADGAAGAASAA